MKPFNRSHEPTDAYRRGWDRLFGPKSHAPDKTRRKGSTKGLSQNRLKPTWLRTDQPRGPK